MGDKRIRALALISGGLDSILAIRVLQEQGIEVVGISFVTPFFGAENARKGADDLGIELIVEDITDIHLELVKRPPHGHGKYMNPCIDCHALMIKVAGEVMEREGFDLIATGEVLGERPMSQNYESLMTVGRDSGRANVLLRPLSAKLLPETRPELEGKVDRERLMDIQGRSRKPQMALAERYGIKSYVQPAGGCLLTDPAFSRRLKDLFAHDSDPAVEEIRMLRIGRHFRFADGAKVIVGRDEKENRRIEDAARQQDVVLVTMSVPGPSSLIVGGGDDETIRAAAELTAAHGDAGGEDVIMELRHCGSVRQISVIPGKREEWIRYRI